MKCGIRWCINVVWLLFLPRVLSGCQGIESLSLSVHPERTILVPYGQPLEMFCQDDKGTADDLQFVRQSEVLPYILSHKINTTTIRLFIEHHEKGVYKYYCRNNYTKKVCPSRVVVDSPPMNVADFACKSKNLDFLNCTWTSPLSYSATNYTLSTTRDGISVGHCCIPQMNGQTRYCTWSSTNLPRYKQQTTQFLYNLKFCNVFGCNEQNFSIDHYTILKPDPPYNLKVLRNDTHSVLLSWSIPTNMVDILPHGVDHKIEYQINKLDNKSYSKADTSLLPSQNRAYKFLLSGLHAYTQYEVRIYIRPKDAVSDEFWSDFTYLVFYTASEKPEKPPDTVVGAFDQNLYETTRRIYVYWKQLEEYEEAGANFTYKAVTRQRTENTKTILADKKKSLSYIVLEDASLEAINIDIWATNIIGSSLNKSHIYIPPIADTVPLKVPSLTKLAYENGTYRLSWVGIDKIDNYTLFWCEHQTTKICDGRIDFTILESHKIYHVIDLPEENRYQFAISANNGTKTSGMVWTTCDISKDAIPMYGFPVKLNHGAPGKSFVKITWAMACTLQEGIITSYNITYCPVKDTSNQCDASFNKSYVIITNPNQNEINITDLKPYRTYQFTLSLNTAYGLKTIDNASTGVTTTEDTPTSPRNVTITEVESNSLVISWDPPLEKNGIIRKYVIYNYTQEYFPVPDKVNDSVRRSVKLEGLDGFSNYSWSVVACNSAINSCSQKSPPNGIFLRTRIGPPSKLKAPTILSSSDVIKWEAPENPGGTVDLYQILRIKDDKTSQIFNTSRLSYALANCKGGVSVEKYQVRAINFDEDPNYGVLADRMEVDLPKRINFSRLEYLGEWSEPITITCKEKGGSTITYVVVTIIVLLVCAILAYEFVQFYKRKRCQIL